jgi:transposase-like protein
MHRSHLPIQEWFWAAYLVATLTPGISATQLQRQLGVGSYQTAWFMLKRLRRGMVNDSRSLLSDLVEADETFVGGPVKGRKGRGVVQDENVALVIGVVEIMTYTTKKGVQKERAKRLRLRHIQHASAKTIRQFLDDSVTKGTAIRTDGWRGYSQTALKDYDHDQTIVGKKPAHQLAPHIHRVFSNLKTWLQGTHHGVHPKYLQEYLDEYVFRFNRRQAPMAAFQTLLGITTQKRPKTLHQIMGVK